MSKHILLVEDNESDELLTIRAFRKANIANEIVVARTGLEALDYFFSTGAYAGREAGMPSVTLLDLNLPGLSGLDVLKRLRTDERTRLLPVVVLTSSKEDEDRIRSYSQGANAYVQKPVDFGEFVEATRALGLFWMLVNQTPPGP